MASVETGAGQAAADVAARDTVPGVGPAGEEDVEGNREGVRVEAAAHPLGQAPVGRTGHGGSGA